VKESDPLQVDLWLTNVVNRPCYKLASHRFVTRKDLTDLPQAAFVWAKLPVEKIEDCAKLIDIGFYIVDTNLKYSGSLSINSSMDSTIRLAQPHDQEVILGIAATAFQYSRFHLDENFSDGIANQTRVSWVKSFFDGDRGDVMIVAIDKHDQPVGFLLSKIENNEITIDLVALEVASRGQGLASAMIGSLSLYYPDGNLLKVGTQAVNIPSVRLYEKLGFHVSEANHILHWHSTRDS